jgi:cell division protein FtsB
VRFPGSFCKKYLLYLAGFITVLFLFTIFGGRDLMHIYQLRQDREKIKFSNARLRAENIKVAAQIERMKHSKKEVERIAREELGLVKRGEVVYQFER